MELHGNSLVNIAHGEVTIQAIKFSMRDSLDILLLLFFLMLFCLFVFLCYSILCIVHAFVPSSLAMIKKVLVIMLLILGMFAQTSV